MTTPPARSVPTLSESNRGFWTAGADDELRLRRCQNCRHWVHPPTSVCPKCGQRDMRWEPTSGKATLYSFTVNRKAWNPDVPVPYVIGMVELPEQVGLRMTSNIVNCEVDQVYIGMPLRATFERHGDVYVPLFEPDRRETGS